MTIAERSDPKRDEQARQSGENGALSEAQSTSKCDNAWVSGQGKIQNICSECSLLKRILCADSFEKMQHLLEALQDLDLTDKVKVLHWQSGGGCADIFLGRMKNNAYYLAIKKPRFCGMKDMLAYTKVCHIICQCTLTENNQGLVQKVSREMRIWALLFHDNILPLKGYIIESGTGHPSMVTEWMNNGSLKQYIYSR